MKLRLLSAAIALWACSTCWADHAKQVDDLVRPLVEGEAIVGCVVGVIDAGVKEVYGYGKVELGKDQTPDGSTIYEIGSITKAFTGMLLADMAQRGEVTLDMPLQELLPDGVTVPVADNQPITLTHLVTHASGLPRMPDNFKPADAGNPFADYTTENMYSFLSGHKLRRAPGEYEYSNYGMGLLGTVLAARAGRSYEELVTERIIKPLGMNDTRITLTDNEKARLAPPYNAELAPDRNWDLPAFAGAGALRSDVDDCLKLLDAALATDPPPVEQADVVKAIQMAWEPRQGQPGEIRVGLGWHLAKDGVMWFHDGRTGGYSSSMFAYPPKRLGVVVLTNTAFDGAPAIGEKVIQSMLGMTVGPIPFRKGGDVDRETLEKYVGAYSIVPWFGITVTLESDRLMAQATGQQKFQIFAESSTKFFYKVVDAQITFVAGEDGKVAKLILHQNGRDLPAVRLDAKKSESE